MIGGIDIRLPSKAGLESIEVATRAVRQSWPRAVFEHGDSGERYAYFWQVPFGELRELFVYRDNEVANVWDARGAVPEVSNTMIHIIYDDDLITLVIDQRDAQMDTIVEAVRSALNDSILYICAELAEAA